MSVKFPRGPGGRTFFSSKSIKCYIKYLTIYKMQMHASAIGKVLYGCVYVREIIHLLKLVAYLPVHTHKPYNNLHLFFLFILAFVIIN